MSDYWKFKTLDEQSTSRAHQLLARADAWRDAKLEEYALNCERKALRFFEHSFWLRNFPAIGVPYPWITCAYGPHYRGNAA